MAYFGAGLPDIKGEFDNSDELITRLSIATGAFHHRIYDGTGADKQEGSGVYRSPDIIYAGADFAASFYDSIYGASTTVQPSAMTVNFYVRAR